MKSKKSLLYLITIKEKKPTREISRYPCFFQLFSRVLFKDHRNRLGGLGGTVGGACEEFEDNGLVADRLRY